MDILGKIISIILEATTCMIMAAIVPVYLLVGTGVILYGIIRTKEILIEDKSIRYTLIACLSTLTTTYITWKIFSTTSLLYFGLIYLVEGAVILKIITKNN